MLYQQVRPRTLDEMVGNEATVAALRAVLGQEERPHVFLFAGPPGCGKTSLARILARRLDCDLEVGFMEINAAEARGIDTIRELQKLIPFRPWRGSCRIILMDEAHMLTTQAQQSLLKILEDIPLYQYFVLCSTEPERIIPTIRNRCAAYAVKHLRPPKMKALLRSVSEQLDAKVESEVIDLIASAAEGSPRQALVLLEQVLGLDAEGALDAIQGGSVTQRGVKDLCQALLAGAVSFQRVAELLAQLDDEPERIRRAVIGYMDVVLRGRRTQARKAGHASLALEVFLQADTFRSGRPALTFALVQFCGRLNDD